MGDFEDVPTAVKLTLPLDRGLNSYEVTSSAFVREKLYKEYVRDPRCRDLDLCRSFPSAILERHRTCAILKTLVLHPEDRSRKICVAVCCWWVGGMWLMY